MTSIDYVGNELVLFEAATNWKKYIRKALRRHIAGDVAEIGAGIGSTARTLSGGKDVKSWLCIEPDPELFSELAKTVRSINCGHDIKQFHGTLDDFPGSPAFDTIIYIDVLEHIEHDSVEINFAAERLRSGGVIIVLCPAFQQVFSAFDRAIRHYRRYTKTTLRALKPTCLDERAAFYLDSVGLAASFANKMLLKESMPTKRQIWLWDSLMVPASRLLDRVFGHLFGKSVVLIWTKP